MPTCSPWRARPAILALVGCLACVSARAEVPKVPEGFTIRLVASVPAVEYPSQVATAPDGSLFVAEDPMDQVGPYEAFDGRILRVRDGQPPVTFADGFRAIQGMAWHDDALYVCHMPFLTIVRDADGDGVAEFKDDLFKDLGPTDNRGLNDHIVSGLQFGMDGWLYISVGDKGVPGATRPEDGQVVQLKGGGVLRCRPDGTRLEVVSSGTRNHLEANLDAADRIFTYDNTDDGDGWWTRVTHHIDGGYYGYPYDYHDRPDVMLPAMAEYGGGSPCGAVFYREDAWPEAWRGVGFWAEWGKGKVHAFRFRPRGATFEVAEAIDFAVPNGTENFRPIDLALSHDGRALYVADWNMGGWGREEKVGRIWAIEYAGESNPAPRGHDADSIPDQIAHLGHPAHSERMRAQQALVRAGADALPALTAALRDPSVPTPAKTHAIWTLDAIAGGFPEATMPILDQLAASEPEVRAQAARALGLRAAPIAQDGLIGLLDDPEPVVRLEAVIALGRIGDPQVVPKLLPILADEDTYLAFSTRVALRRIKDWAAIAEGLKSDNPRIREGVLLTLERMESSGAIETLAAYARALEPPASERARALTFAAEVHRLAEPWNGRWWGTRPTRGAPPSRVIEWVGTPMVREAVRSSLADSETAVRLAAVQAVKTIDDRDALPILRTRFSGEPDAEVRRAIAGILGVFRDSEAVPLLVEVVRDKDADAEVRRDAIDALDGIGSNPAVGALIDVLERGDLSIADQERVIAALGRHPRHGAVEILTKTLTSPEAALRRAAAEALGQIRPDEDVAPSLRGLLTDADLDVRKAAIRALGAMRDRDAVPGLLEASRVPDTAFEATMALTAIPDTRAIHVYLQGLTSRNADLRRASASALTAIRDEATPILTSLHERNELPPRVIPELRSIYTWARPLRDWNIVGPFAREAEPPMDLASPIDFGSASYEGLGGQQVAWREARGDERGMIDLGSILGGDSRAAYGYVEVGGPSRTAELRIGSDDTLTVWLNGENVYEFTGDRGFTAEQDRVNVTLRDGINRLLVRCGNSGGGWQFAVAITDTPDHAFLNAPSEGTFDPETFREFALSHDGNPERGRDLFADAQGLACLKCHVVAGQGGNVGPDLSGIGAKYPKEDLITSVLYPSRQIFSGYEPVVVATADGRILTGILKSETAEALEIQDAEAVLVRIPVDEIEERRTSDVSIMPSGLAEGLEPRDFTDLIAYLTSLKEPAVSADASTADSRTTDESR